MRSPVVWLACLLCSLHPLAAQEGPIVEVAVTAITWFRAQEDGSIVTSEQWNTMYPDDAWDIGVYEGPVITQEEEFEPDDSHFWLNNRTDLTVTIALRPCERRTFSLHASRGDLAVDDRFYYGVNLFFDGSEQEARAGISVFALASKVGPGQREAFPEFAANSAPLTMGWPFDSNIPAATGGLVYQDAAKKLKIELTDFVCFGQLALGGGQGVDLGTRLLPGNKRFIDEQDGSPDLVAQFTLTVDSLDDSLDCKLEPRFKRGDSNGDGVLSINDPITGLEFQFLGREPGCRDALDFNDDGLIDLGDPVGNICHQLLSGTPPPLPGKDSCGPDPTPDSGGEDLGCLDYPPDRC